VYSSRKEWSERMWYESIHNAANRIDCRRVDFCRVRPNYFPGFIGILKKLLLDDVRIYGQQHNNHPIESATLACVHILLFFSHCILHVLLANWNKENFKRKEEYTACFFLNKSIRHPLSATHLLS
jgi:hypothetical protein